MTRFTYTWLGNNHARPPCFKCQRDMRFLNQFGLCVACVSKALHDRDGDGVDKLAYYVNKSGRHPEALAWYRGGIAGWRQFMESINMKERERIRHLAVSLHNAMLKIVKHPAHEKEFELGFVEVGEVIGELRAIAGAETKEPCVYSSGLQGFRVNKT